MRRGPLRGPTALERVRDWLPWLAVVAALLCIAELLWLRTAQFAATPLQIGLLFLPWLLAAAANLGLWHNALVRAPPTPWRRFVTAVWVVTVAGFVAGFAALYAGLLFGWW